MLQGRWVGTPDTAEARARREAQRYDDPLQTEEESPNGPGPKTDWEAFDVTVQLDFLSHSEVVLSLAGENQPVKGTWEVLESTPAGALIQIDTPAPASPGNDEAGVVRRQFRIEYDLRDGELVGFLMTEAGADPRLGALYFRRPE